MNLNEIKIGTMFKYNDEYLKFGEDIFELDDSSPEIEDFKYLTKKFKKDGYLFFKNFHNESVIDNAKKFTLKAINKEGGLKKNTNIFKGIISKENKNYSFFRNLNISHSKEILDLVNSRKINIFFENFFGKKITTLDKTWFPFGAYFCTCIICSSPT